MFELSGGPCINDASFNRVLCSLKKAKVAKVAVNAIRLRVKVMIVMPQDVKLRRKLISGTMIRLIPTLRAALSMPSSSFFGNNALIRQKPGRKRTKIDPNKYRT